MFPEEWNPLAVAVAAGMSLAFLVVGALVFRRLEPSVLKEL